MVGTVELQFDADAFARATLSELRQRVICARPPIGGMQLQRLIFVQAATRNTESGSFLTWLDLGSGPGSLWLTGMIPELVVQVVAEMVSVDAILASPNGWAPVSSTIDATVVLEAEVTPDAPAGWLELTLEVSEVHIGESPLPTDSISWIRTELQAVLSHDPVRLDLSGLLPEGRNFLNAGIGMDASGSRLVIRAEQPMPALATEWRWRVFRNGSIPDRLAGNDWCIFLTAADLNNTITTQVRSRVREELGSDAHMLTTVEFIYQAHGDRASFLLNLWIDAPWLPLESLPILVTLSARDGRAIIDVDLSGVADLVQKYVVLATVIVNVFLPVVGWTISAVLHELAADLLRTGDIGIATGVPGELRRAPRGTVFEHVAPLSYRLTLPLAAPAGVTGRIERLVAHADGIAFVGRWGIPGGLGSVAPPTIDVWQFGWVAPTVPCGASGESALHRFTEEPTAFASLAARVILTGSGNAPVRLCEVRPLSIPAGVDPNDIQVTWAAGSLPATIEFTARASLAAVGFKEPLRYLASTSAGEFLIELDPPPQLTEADVRMMRSLIVVQLRACDAVVRPPWFDADGIFDLRWIVDPLLDPDPDRVKDLAIVGFEAAGLPSGAWVRLTDGADGVIQQHRVNARGVGSVSALLNGAAQNLLASVDLAPPRRFADLFEQTPADRSTETSLAFTVRSLRHVGSLAAPTALYTLVGRRDGFGAGYLAVGADTVTDIAVDASGHLLIREQWALPGVHGVVATSDATFAFGEMGLALLTPGRAERIVDGFASSAAGSGALIVVAHDRLEILSSGGQHVAWIETEAPPNSVTVSGHTLLVGTAAGLLEYDISDPREPRILEVADQFAEMTIHRSEYNGRGYVRSDEGLVAELERNGTSWLPVGVFETEPLALAFARSGNVLANLSHPGGAETYIETPARQLMPQDLRA